MLDKFKAKSLPNYTFWSLWAIVAKHLLPCWLKFRRNLKTNSSGGSIYLFRDFFPFICWNPPLHIIAEANRAICQSNTACVILLIPRCPWMLSSPQGWNLSIFLWSLLWNPSSLRCFFFCLGPDCFFLRQGVVGQKENNSVGQTQAPNTQMRKERLI